MDNEVLAGNAGSTAPAEGNPPDTSTGNAGKESGTATDTRIADLEAKLAKESKDKEIYRAGLLAAKDLSKRAKKLSKEDLEDPDKMDAHIEARVQDAKLEELRQAAIAEAEKAKAESQEDVSLRKENEELRRSIAAMSAAGGVGGVGGSAGINEHSESKPQGYWSDAQKNELRQIYSTRGFYSSEQIDKMVSKAEDIAKTKTAQSALGNGMYRTRTY